MMNSQRAKSQWAKSRWANSQWITSSWGRVRTLGDRLSRDGMPAVSRLVAARALAAVSGKWNLEEPVLPLREQDIMDPQRVQVRHVNGQRSGALPGGGALRLGWVCTPPAPGSGGHTTFFRMVRGMEERGHQCTLYLYDRNADDVDRHEETIRSNWPALGAGVRSATQGMEGVDALVASSWQTAHVVAARAPVGVRSFYFIQDYEPYFHPRGFLYSLAEDSYKLGLTAMALGSMIGEVMKAELGQEPAFTVPFGCDTDAYRLLLPTQRRTGVVYYAKRNVDRRGYLLAKMALEMFHHSHPDQEIHIYGDLIRGWSIPVTNHGNLPPGDLNRLYNSVIAGLAISFTNISLVPGELLASGAVPVLNRAAFASGLLQDDGAVWADSTPSAVAEALSKVVEHSDVQGRAAAISRKRRTDWSESKDAFAGFIEQACGTPSLRGWAPASGEGGL
ncbi:glycosyltransferase family 1 protein [Paenarthrobacter ilicis]|uniref:glycosyltransferase family 1 protein n=1 Tax=Paenarthrobacter ilicis TaxID=43665 RepID=UPI00386C3233